MSNPTDPRDRSELTSVQILSFVDRLFLLTAAMLATLGWLVMASRIMSDTHPIWDLASHLSWHIWVATSGVLTFASVFMRACSGERRIRWWHRFIMVLPPWLYFTWVTSPLMVLPILENKVETSGLKILSWNVWIMNHDPEQVLKLVKEHNADMLVLIELGHEQAQVLKQLESDYPYCHWMPDYSSRGIAVLSRVEGTQFSSHDLAGEGMPAIEAIVPGTETHGSHRIIAVHTRSPDLHQRTLDRNRQLQSLAEWAIASKTPSIIVGDLNITPWSPPFWRLIEQGQLVDSRNYRGHFATWPTDLGYFAIPIDHALVSKGTKVVYRSVGHHAPDSDHRPIILTVK